MKDERKVAVIGIEGPWSLECQAIHGSGGKRIDITLQCETISLTPYMTTISEWLGGKKSKV
jgi:hypothetical protein